MKRKSNLRSLLLVLSSLCYCSSLFGQAFPEYWDLSNYDMEQGRNGRIFEINTDAQEPNAKNKAVIFTTSTSNGRKDLFRLTLAGVATLNSPFSSFPIKLDFYAQNSWQGYLQGNASRLDLIGKSEVRVGTNDNFDVLSITPGQISLGGNIKQDYGGKKLRYGISDDQQSGWIGTESNHSLVLGTYLKSAIYLDENQKVYIGMTPNEAKAIRSEVKNAYTAFVKKGLLAEDLAIGPQSSWSDFVFERNYRLRPLSEVEKFIRTNKHLPDVPSAKDVAEKGYSQHEINKVLLQKVEELTLYILEQQKEIEALKAKLEGQAE